MSGNFKHFLLTFQFKTKKVHKKNLRKCELIKFIFLGEIETWKVLRHKFKISNYYYNYY